MDYEKECADHTIDTVSSLKERIRELEHELQYAGARCEEVQDNNWQQDQRIRELEAENKQLLGLSENLDEHPEGYDGPCLCKLCKSYG